MTEIRAFCYAHVMSNHEVTTGLAGRVADLSTGVLISMAFRTTPHYERENWTCTSEDRYDSEGNEVYSQDELRDFVIEQLEEYGITRADINNMRS